MILPGKIEFEGVIGTTFDGEFLVYPQADSLLKWDEKDPVWNAAISYEDNAGVVGSNGLGYKSVKPSLDINPVTDTEEEYWEELVPQDLTGYKAEVKLSTEVVLKNGEGIGTLGPSGVVKFKATRIQTEKFVKGNEHIAFLMENTEEDYYEYGSGIVKWKEQ